MNLKKTGQWPKTVFLSLLRGVAGLNQRINLRTALILYVLLPMGVIAAVAAWWGLRAFERQVEERMQNDLKMVARAIEKPLNHALSRERDGGVMQALESAFKMSHVYGAYLYDAEGEKITDPVIEEEAETDKKAETEEADPAEAKELLSSPRISITEDEAGERKEVVREEIKKEKDSDSREDNGKKDKEELEEEKGEFEEEIDRDEVGEMMAEGERHGEFGEIDGREVYSYFVPLTDSGGGISAFLQLTRRRSDFHEQIRNARYKATGIFIFSFLGLTGLVLYGHHRGFGKHMLRLSQTMNRIAEGDRRQRYVPRGPREIITLGDHFNSMMDNIERAEMEIERRRNHQRELEERLRHTEKLAAIGELAAGVAHELGNPLSLVDAKAQRAMRQDDLPDIAARSLRDIRGAAGRMERTIRQLRDFSSRNQIEISQVQAGQVIRSSVAAVAHEAETHDTEIVVNKSERSILTVDSTRIEQALVNLLRNAIQAAPGGRVEVGWHVNGGNQTREVVFEVRDNGPGIEEKYRAKLFEPFFTTKAVGEGTGLGLAVVHGIAEEHNGRVEVESDNGRGSCFRLIVPG